MTVEANSKPAAQVSIKWSVTAVAAVLYGPEAPQPDPHTKWNSHQSLDSLIHLTRRHYSGDTGLSFGLDQ